MSNAHASGRPANEPEPIDVTPQPADLWPFTANTSSAQNQDGNDDGRQRGGASRWRRIALGSLLAVGLAGAAVLGTAGWRVLQQKDASLETPAQVAGLTRDDSDRARETADYLRTAFAADISVTKSIGAVYVDPSDAGRSVLLFGGTTLLWRPEQDLDTLFELVSDDAKAFTDLRTVPAGGLGGVMKCGTTASPEGDLTVCGWADHGSVALAMFPGNDIDGSATMLRDIRAAVQTRN